MKFENELADGREVRIYVTDGAGDFPIHGAIKNESGWFVQNWTKSGNFLNDKESVDLDLVPIEELKPCPFCGHECSYMSEDDMSELYSGVTGENDGWYVVCDGADKGCGASGGWGGTKKDAKKKWNRRIA